ncbi:hypothetical protein ARMGADRAFT_449187 [Armillaria gallica]|uniref:Secreted protein n=1 Tax=Armillaria gallica TaxID=47427 RepID=A0A2H3D9X0_ARMGA|nr:hypothetical protein ARMGADRAFT_449187 [Armillaria gallica]
MREGGGWWIWMECCLLGLQVVKPSRGCGSARCLHPSTVNYTSSSPTSDSNTMSLSRQPWLVSVPGNWDADRHGLWSKDGTVSEDDDEWMWGDRWMVHACA